MSQTIVAGLVNSGFSAWISPTFLETWFGEANAQQGQVAAGWVLGQMDSVMHFPGRMFEAFATTLTSNACGPLAQARPNTSTRLS